MGKKKGATESELTSLVTPGGQSRGNVTADNAGDAAMAARRESQQPTLSAYNASPGNMRSQFRDQGRQSSDLGEGRATTSGGYVEVKFEGKADEAASAVGEVKVSWQIEYPPGEFVEHKTMLGKIDGSEDPATLLGTSWEKGLTEAQVQDRLEKYGYNELPEVKKNIWLLLLKEFIGPMPIIVWLAIILETVESIVEYNEPNGIGDQGGQADLIDVVALLLLQFLNVFVGFFEELKADEKITALKKSLLPKALVKRTVTTDGRTEVKEIEIDAREVVVGDIVSLPLGKAIPADGVIEPEFAGHIEVDESMLTGESLPVKKVGHKRNDPAKVVWDRQNEVKMSSIVKTNECHMIVFATGPYTEFGKTAQLLSDKSAVGHFEELLQVLLWVLVVMGLIVNIIIMIYLATLHSDGRSTAPDTLSLLSFAVVLLIASIPIALRVVCVTTLALGCNQLSKEKVIVSKINAVEEIASMTLLCSDKTGTLTQNKMEMQFHDAWINNRCRNADGKVFAVDSDYLMQHAALGANWEGAPGDALDTLVLGYVCKYEPLKHAMSEHYYFDKRGFEPFNASKKRTGSLIWPVGSAESVEVMLPMARVEKPGCPADLKPHERETDEWSKIQQLTNEEDEKFVRVMNNHYKETEPFMVTKGAPHIVLNMIDDVERKEIEDEFHHKVTELGQRGIRSLAVAVQYLKPGSGAKLDDKSLSIEDIQDPTNKKKACKGWTMLGLLAFKDPVRPDSRETVTLCREMGVSVKMITGDQGLIAKETSKELGLPCKEDSICAVVVQKDKSTWPLQSFENAQDLTAYAEDPACPLIDMVNPSYCFKKGTTEIDTEASANKRTYGQICEEAGGFAQVFPEHKYLIVATLQQLRYADREPVGMTGDGVNDAPALHRANIGIAVEGATDAARGASDIVLTRAGLNAVVSAITVSRKIFTRMKNFVVYRIACTLQLLFFFLLAALIYDPAQYCASVHYFDLPVIALVTIVILNDGTIISVAFDNVFAAQFPESWNMPVLWIVSSVVGGVALISSVLILDLALGATKYHQHQVYKGFTGCDLNEGGLCGNHGVANADWTVSYTRLDNGKDIISFSGDGKSTCAHWGNITCDSTWDEVHGMSAFDYTSAWDNQTITNYHTKQTACATGENCGLDNVKRTNSGQSFPQTCTTGDDNWFQTSGIAAAFHMDTLTFSETRTLMYLKIALSDYLSLFNSRCQGWFFSRAPSIQVIGAAIFSTVCSSLLAKFWPFQSDMNQIEWGVVGFVWLYVAVWGLVQDTCKVTTYCLLKATGMIDASKLATIDEDAQKQRMEDCKHKSETAYRLKEEKESVVLKYEYERAYQEYTTALNSGKKGKFDRRYGAGHYEAYYNAIPKGTRSEWKELEKKQKEARVVAKETALKQKAAEEEARRLEDAAEAAETDALNATRA